MGYYTQSSVSTLQCPEKKRTKKEQDATSIDLLVPLKSILKKPKRASSKKSKPFKKWRDKIFEFPTKFFCHTGESENDPDDIYLYSFDNIVRLLDSFGDKRIKKDFLNAGIPVPLSDSFDDKETEIVNITDGIPVELSDSSGQKEQKKGKLTKGIPVKGEKYKDKTNSLKTPIKQDPVLPKSSIPKGSIDAKNKDTCEKVKSNRLNLSPKLQKLTKGIPVKGEKYKDKTNSLKTPIKQDPVLPKSSIPKGSIDAKNKDTCEKVKSNRLNLSPKLQKLTKGIPVKGEKYKDKTNSLKTPIKQDPVPSKSSIPKGSIDAKNKDTCEKVKSNRLNLSPKLQKLTKGIPVKGEKYKDKTNSLKTPIKQDPVLPKSSIPKGSIDAKNKDTCEKVKSNRLNLSPKLQKLTKGIPVKGEKYKDKTNSLKTPIKQDPVLPKSSIPKGSIDAKNKDNCEKVKSNRLNLSPKLQKLTKGIPVKGEKYKDKTNSLKTPIKQDPVLPKSSIPKGSIDAKNKDTCEKVKSNRLNLSPKLRKWFKRANPVSSTRYNRNPLPADCPELENIFILAEELLSQYLPDLCITEAEITIRDLGLPPNTIKLNNYFYKLFASTNGTINERELRKLRHECNIEPLRKINMTPVTDQERKIIIEFCHLLEKSKHSFNGLRELPPYGHKQWHVPFGRTFDIYAKLWKYQQQHRLLLDSRYGLKRWQIGEVASKIGQLYYHYYLRTSDTAYLTESYSFYSAIRSRHYYHLASKEGGCDLMVKKLRFYARFIVVAILLKQMKMVDELVAELEQQVLAYGQMYDPTDQVEWFNVLAEVKAFIDVEQGVVVIDPLDKNRPVTIGGRINEHSVPPIELTPQMYLTLEDAIIIGSGTQLVKFSELTLDMFRMLQNLEWEVDVPNRNQASGSPKENIKRRSEHSAAGESATYRRGGNTDEEEQQRKNPHKFLLFKPSASQILVYLASSCNDLSPKGATLLYISANGYSQQNNANDDHGYGSGGVITSSKSDIFKEYNKEAKASTSKTNEPQILYPGDLQPYTRKPLFIVVDSDNSYSFQDVPKAFGQPLIVLMSPQSIPEVHIDQQNRGSLFTLFLQNPVAGLCISCGIYKVFLSVWDRCATLLEVFMMECCKLLMRLRIDPTFYAFFGDVRFRVLILRYIFCVCTLRMHKSFRTSCLPRSVPVLPEELFVQEALFGKILSMAQLIGISKFFVDPLMPGPLNSE